MVLGDGELAVNVTDQRVALLRGDIVALETENMLIMIATEAPLYANNGVEHDKLLVSLPNMFMTKRELVFAIKAARMRIREFRAVKERHLKKQTSSLPRA